MKRLAGGLLKPLNIESSPKNQSPMLWYMNISDFGEAIYWLNPIEKQISDMFLMVKHIYLNQ